MSFYRKSAKNTARRVLADSANAKHRFGFAGEFGSTVLSAPKLSDLWYIEFNTVTDGSFNNTQGISALAKAVSPISIQMSSMPVDQYGKRVHVPTRVDFPEVNITMYDTVDGKMFGVAESIYNKFFKNQDAKVNGMNAEAVLTSAHEHGRKLPDSSHEYYHQHFEKITIYHFFGNLESTSIKPGTNEFSGARANPTQGTTLGNLGTGTLQKIELINPLVTGITFSGSDYSVTELRTTDLSIQPENIIIGQVDENVVFPDWMTLGMDYMLDELSPQLTRKEGNLYPDHFGDTGYGPNTVDGRFKEKITDELKQDEQEYEDTNRKLSELMTLYNAQIQNPNETGNAELERALKKRIGVISAARAKRFSKYADHPKNKFDTPYEATYTNPDIPTFGGIGNSNPPKDMFPPYSTDIGDSLVQELIGSFFGKRKFDASNIKNAFKNKMIEATGFPMNTAIDGRRIIDGAKGSAQGAYQTTVKANESVVTKSPVVHKTNNTELPMGMSKAILRKILNN
ncbi:MAG: hypothetical protein H8D95_01675 [Candidatus Endolissoclinum sp.]|nr:hypothetical protein [Candidatus Endolissoclinum sp.]